MLVLWHSWGAVLSLVGYNECGGLFRYLSDHSYEGLIVGQSRCG